MYGTHASPFWHAFAYSQCAASISHEAAETCDAGAKTRERSRKYNCVAAALRKSSPMVLDKRVAASRRERACFAAADAVSRNSVTQLMRSSANIFQSSLSSNDRGLSSVPMKKSYGIRFIVLRFPSRAPFR